MHTDLQFYRATCLVQQIRMYISGYFTSDYDRQMIAEKLLQSANPVFFEISVLTLQ